MQRIGVAGIGNISKIYLDNLSGMFGRRVKLAAVTDVAFERAEKAAADYKLKAFKSLNEMLKSGDVDIILNITPPKFHFDVALASVKAGKHVYNEKPLCSKREEAAELLKTAAEKGVRVLNFTIFSKGKNAKLFQPPLMYAFSTKRTKATTQLSSPISLWCVTLKSWDRKDAGALRIWR